MSSLLGNAIAMLAARLVPPVFSFAINVAVARIAGVDVLGAYVYLLSLLMIFQAVAGAGMPLLVTREIAAHPEREHELVRHARTIALGSGLAAMAGFLLYALSTAEGPTEYAAMVLAMTLLPSAWIAVQEAYFIARREHHAVTAVATLENLVKLALSAVVFLAGGGLIFLCVAILVARLVALATGQVLMARNGCRGAWRLDPAGARPLARALPPFAAILVLAMVYFRTDVLVLGALRGEAETGIYGAALTLYSIALLLPDSVMSAVYPRLAGAFRTHAEGYARATLLSAKMLAIALVPVSVGLIVLARLGLTTIYGERFAAAAAPLALLAASLPIHAVNAAFGQALQAGGHQKAMLGIGIVGTAFHVVATVVLVTLIGVLGAPIALLLSSSLLALLAARLFHTRVARIEPGVGTLIGASAVVAPIVLALLSPDRLTPLAVAGGLGWLAVLLLGRQVFPRAELDEVARALRGRRAEAGA